MIFLEFDVSRRSTFDNIDVWINEFHASLSPSTPILLIANKWDLPEHSVSIEEIKLRAELLKCPFFTCSAIEGTNLEDVFLYAAYKFFELNPEMNNQEDSINIEIQH